MKQENLADRLMSHQLANFFVQMIELGDSSVVGRIDRYMRGRLTGAPDPIAERDQIAADVDRGTSDNRLKRDVLAAIRAWSVTSTPA